MITRAVVLAAGILGAAGGSQAPEFSQQYVQRLGGAVEELQRFVTAFDADAASVGLSRQAALQELAQGGSLGRARAESMRSTMAREARLSATLEAVTGAGPFMRSYAVAKMSDPALLSATWAHYQPALPLTFPGVIFAGGGFVLSGIAGAILVGCLRLLLGRRKRTDRAA
ncbi:DUF2937 family protein [Cognatishimia sp. SS12]|uniref:DUF2937 family protein n=1 Tax=Cognatishimia sp. SS12 TaxID=2979465 RepID=UPI00232F3CEB|nr:DUF2937 family protein [Cognatishimia sp. SS12]MDC0738574.1 DUF2937 family protein [Cognatishimia sp. SS12]